MSQTHRRQFLIGSGALLASPFALAQKPVRPFVIGLLNPDRPPTEQEWVNSTRAKRLRELGWVEGANVLLVHAHADRKSERLAELAGELVRKRVDVILAHSPPAAVAAARATKAIPIVFSAVGFPIELGLVSSLARPGGNITGVASVAGDGSQIIKSLEFIKQMVPSAKRLAGLRIPSSSTTVSGGKVTYPDQLTVISRLGFEMKVHYVERAEDLEPTFAAILSSGTQVVFIPFSSFTYVNRQRIVDFANQHRLPTASDAGLIVDAGGLVSYGVKYEEMVRRSIDYVDRILRGARPADLPVELPKDYELVVNLKTAKALGITVPQSVLVRADRVIE